MLTAGNHSIKDVNGVASEKVKIAHFPVRTPAQIFCKSILGSWNMRLRDREHKEGWQWHNLAKRFIENGMPSYDEFCEISYDYAARRRGKIILDPIKTDVTTLKYTNDEELNIVPMVLNFTELLIQEYGAQ